MWLMVVLFALLSSSVVLCFDFSRVCSLLKVRGNNFAKESEGRNEVRLFSLSPLFFLKADS